MRNLYFYSAIISGVLSLSLGGCASTTNPMGEGYEDPVVPGKIKLLNLTGRPTTEGAAEIYFSASSRKEMGATVRDRLIAFQVDGKKLNGAEAGYTPTGYQALALAPGVHTISFCYTTRSVWSGLVMCEFKVDDFTFESNTRYMVVDNLEYSMRYEGISIAREMAVRTNVLKLN